MIPPLPEKGTGFSNKEFSYRASIPAFASSITIRNTSVLAGSSRAALNTRDAVYYERSSLSGGGKLELRTYFHRTRRNLIVVEVNLDCTNCTKSMEVSLRAFSRPELSDLVFHQHGSGGYTAGADGRVPRQLIGLLRAGENCEPSNAHVYDTNITLGYVHDVCPGSLKAEPGRKTHLQLLSVVTLSNEDSDVAPTSAKEAVVPRALSLYTAAKALAPTKLFEEHRQGWASLWDAGGIELETNDLSLQQTTNSTMYYLLMSTRADWLHSALVPSTIAAAGPKPHGYFGTSFWDQDTFQAPPLMVFYPDIAANLLQNRLFQLPAYRINAKAFGFMGAYIPWEVGFTGGFARDDGCAHQEIHIAPDVSLFIRQYYQLTQNRSALKELYPLLEGISDFLVSRVNRTDAQGWLSIETVIGADESTGRDNIDNDVFSNAASVLALETTLDAADMLSIPTTPHQKTSWRHAAENLKIGFFEGEHRLLHREYDEYPFDNGSKWLHTSVGQTDTILLGFPLQFHATHRVWKGQKERVRLNDILYYQDHISPTGSYMTAGHYVIAWLERQHRSLANASKWFAKGREKNYAPWRIWSEHDENDGGAVNFITAGGVFLQSLVFGYAGLRPDDTGVTLDPLLPPGVTAMRLRGVNYADSEFDILVDGPGSARLSRRSGNGGGSVLLQRDAVGGAYRLSQRSSAAPHD
jgi:hypothetical protein